MRELIIILSIIEMLIIQNMFKLLVVIERKTDITSHLNLIKN